ncbi:MAG: cytochrome c [Rhodospirillales bacterium]
MDGRFVMVIAMLLMLVWVGWRGATNPDATISTASADLGRGQKLFDEHCSECHVSKQGIPLKGPVLGFYGQEYLLTDRQLVESAKGTRYDKDAPKPRPDLTEDQQKQLESLRETMRKTTAKLKGGEVKDIIAFLKKSWSSDAQLEHWFITHQPPDQ